MSLDAPTIWLMLGAALVCLEAFGIPGIGFLFTGLGALLTGLLLFSGVLGDEVSRTGQVAWFFGFTALWAVVLWKPMKKWRMPPESGKGYSNMVGERAEVLDGLVRGKTGRVRWSGATMNAELADGGPGSVAGGASVEIVEVKGNTLVVRGVEPSAM